MFLDDAGHLAFANETAKEVLDLAEDPDTGRIESPLWVIRDSCGQQSDGFRSLVGEGCLDRVPFEVLWPNGWRVGLRISAEPLRDAEGNIGGVVATFERPSLVSADGESTVA
jgi:PAS domain-containing protein